VEGSVVGGIDWESKLHEQWARFGHPCGGDDSQALADWAGEMIRTAEFLIRDTTPQAGPDQAKQWASIRAKWMEGKP
jgi:hypothetical protein